MVMQAHDLDQTLGEAEEMKIVKQIQEMDRRGFFMRADMVRQVARFWSTGKEKKMYNHLP